MNLTVAQATRRYVGLTALRWLPVGITVPVTVLLALSRGLTVAQIGLIFLAHGVVVSVLELPTGGLADTLGRRPVLVGSGLLHATSCLVYAGAESLPGFLLGTVLLGAGRALDSGPLEAWYVDTVRLADPAADVVPGLSRAGVADCLALALGAVAGGLAPVLLASTDALRLPFLTAAGLSVVSVVAVALLVTPTGPHRQGSARRALSRGVAQLPRTVAGTVALAGRDDAIRRILLLAAAGGYCLSTLELLGPGLFRDLTGSTTGGSGVYGVVMAASFLAAAAGSALAPRAARSSTRVGVAGLCVLAGLALAGVATSGLVAVTALAYAGFYLCNAAWWPLVRAVLHDRVGAAQRATVLSTLSLALQAGGALSSVVSPRLGSATGAFLAASAVSITAGLLALRLPAASSPRRLTATAPGSLAAPAARPPAAPARPRRRR